MIPAAPGCSTNVTWGGDGLRRIRIGDLLASPDEIRRFEALVGGGGVAAIPTETFYGLAADPRSAGGVRRVFDAKGRGEEKPLPVVFANRGQLEELGVEAAERLLLEYMRLWPAPLSVVLPLKSPIAASRGQSKLAVRIPASPDLVRLLEATGPLTATSANRSGEPPLADPEDVSRLFEGRIDLLVDGATTPGGLPSTMIDATVDPPVLLRAGAFPWPPQGRGGADLLSTEFAC